MAANNNMKNILLILISLTLMGAQEKDIQKGNKWVKKSYKIEGDWAIKNTNGILKLNFAENFKTSRGPDVKVYLSPKQIEDIDKREPVDKKGVFLGVIENFSGAQSYKIPEGIRLEDYSSIVLHCQAYSVVWGGTNFR